MSASVSRPEGQARLISRTETPVSPWVRLVAKEVQFRPEAAHEVYHCLALADYVAVLARTPGGLIPLIRQYRPAVESYTWELPAGLLDPGETPETACVRELKEETGLVAGRYTYLGASFADTGRLENRQHAFFCEASEPDPSFQPEPGTEVRFVSLDELKGLIADGTFNHQLHVAVVAMASLPSLRLPD